MSLDRSTGLSKLVDAIIKKMFVQDNHRMALQQLAFASVVSMAASALWYFSRTVVEVTDSEQSLWVQLWLAQQTSAISRLRRLALLSAGAISGRSSRSRDPWAAYSGRDKRSEEDDREEEGGRFAPPKLVFAPADGVSAFSWFGCWPVSVASRRVDVDSRFAVYEKNYIITVWFAPQGVNVAKDLILKGRDMWLSKRASKTEIWIANSRPIRNQFNVVTRPSRPLSTVILEGTTKEDIIADAMRFLEGEEWYVRKGIPYRRGFLLHGPPGCGKTSLIYAVAGSLRLPIILLPLSSNELGDDMLVNLLSEAPRDSIILLEDVDCALAGGERNEETQDPERNRMTRRKERHVTLSGLLNAIDGVAAQEGRLLFMTTNHLERLDPALIRPGRVDAQFYLGNASKAGAGELFDQFFDSPEAGSGPSHIKPDILAPARSSFLAEVEEHAHSFAKLQGVLMNARDQPELAAKELRSLVALAKTPSTELTEPISTNKGNHAGS